jgi:hypothetical protein
VTTRYTLTADADQSSFAQQLAASLPLSFTLANGPSDVALVGGEPGWVERALQRIAAGGIVIVRDPSPVASSSVDVLVGEAGDQMVLAETFAGNPALSQLVERCDDLLSTASTIRMHALGADVGTGLLEQIRVLGALGWHSIELIDAQIAPSVGLVTGRCTRRGRTALARLQVSVTSSPRWLCLRAYSADGALKVDLPDAITARPARVEAVTPEGALILPTIYETAHRATMRAIAGEHPLAPQMASFRADLETLESMLA